MELGLDAQQLILQPHAVDGVDGAKRLVHQHDGRVRCQRARDAHPLLLATGELAGVALAIGDGQIDQGQHFVDAFVDASPIPAQQARHRADVVLDE